MKRRELLFALAGVGAIALSPLRSVATSAQELDPLELPAGFQYPNGITRSQDGTLYVGSILSGRILQINSAGEVQTFFEGNSDIFSVTSLRLDEPRHLLWGTSPDVLRTPQSNAETVQKPHRIFAIDSRSGEVRHIIPMPDGGFGNDIALDPQGGVYVTDSLRPRIHYLPPGTTQFQTWAEDDRFRTQLRFGLSGIARQSDGILFVTMYSDGRLFKVTPQSARDPLVDEIELPRRIDGSDAIQFADDGSLIMVEGGVESGNGRLLRLHGLEIGAKPQFNTLASRMDLPVNLTVVGGEIWLTESLFRHRFVSGQETVIPDRFFVRRFALS
ncbi:MAG TPA: gluconolaconase [Leptolyngbyaceae cyanobacterium M33_DOE_097]|uniref:Gluconolaconase n=1 Tax=Oscillatoriales cyanobacterium SpSt-418 TaxID=2282169 RepID=A0A7C3KIR9_9CYAN|nr:gluconolaconase [Leptolyngbyaceae cyanobacterium M33_DOE_097]